MIRLHFLFVLFGIVFSVGTVCGQQLRVVALEEDLAAGTDDGAVFREFALPVINNSGQVAFRSVLSGGGTTTSNRNGLWLDDNGSLSKIVRSGESTPAGSAGSTFTGFSNIPNLNDNGQVAFNGGLGGIPSQSSVYIYDSGSINLVAPTNQRLGNFSQQGEFFLIGENASGEDALWAGSAGATSEIIATGSQATGAEPGVTFRLLSNFAPIYDGVVTFRGFLEGTNVTTSNDSGLWQWNGGTTELFAREGDLIHSSGSERFGGFWDPVTNTNGDIAFGGSIQTVSDAFFRKRSGGDFEIVVREGTLAPDTAPGLRIDEMTDSNRPKFNNRGNLAFTSGLFGEEADTNNDSAIWITQEDNLKKIAWEGEQATDLPAGVVFEDLRSGSGPVLNDWDQVAFTAFVRGTGTNLNNNLVMYATDRDGNLKLLFREGDELEIAPGDTRTLAGFSLFSGSSASGLERTGFNNRGEIAFVAIFDDGSSGVFVSNLVAVPEPSATLLCGFVICAILLKRRKMADLRS